MIVTVNDFLLLQETEYIDHEKYFSILAAVTCATYSTRQQEYDGLAYTGQIT